ncbi:helix-turn-helix domain-containing protein [Clostridium sardiniense]|uniref:Helix-turn-helix domain-containing protein n=1 Tax=Clostridium sardiniense TaxID=29369 RepID=A0ABS7L2Q2_CLOSR|nr:helix-turn-helix transcriptional regulator [Clostridium sardiniense]MBY0757182.1 helix-turn-helix domain-containing protein [Clostridium sardiniense]MDQ0461642.1 transcriptional regulator with XRE-family HTH domain [Clostridium sardiniense]
MLSENIIRLRKEQSISLRKLSNLVGVGSSVIFNIEKNNTKNPRIDTVCKIAEVLNVSLDELVYGKRTE